VGGCVDPADEHIIASGIVFPAMVKCGEENVGNDPPQLDCIENATGLSQPCAICEDDYVRCILVNCLSQCISVQTSPDCTGCRAVHCDAAFEACSGLPTPPH
jgi:hypothetical protein